VLVRLQPSPGMKSRNAVTPEKVRQVVPTRQHQISETVPVALRLLLDILGE